MTKTKKVIKSIESYSPSTPLEIKPFRSNFRLSGEVQQTISKHKNDQSGKKYYIQKTSKRRSKEFDTCYDFRDGYALVIDKERNKKFYIDQDFNTLVCEDKVQNSEDLTTLIKYNALGLVKYVSPKKMYEIYNDTIFSSIVPGYCPKEDINQLVKNIKIMDAFFDAFNIDKPSECDF